MTKLFFVPSFLLMAATAPAQNVDVQNLDFGPIDTGSGAVGAPVMPTASGAPGAPPSAGSPAASQTPGTTPAEIPLGDRMLSTAIRGPLPPGVQLAPRYQGLQLGTESGIDRPKMRGGRNALNWVGYARSGNRDRVFFQTQQPATFTVALAPDNTIIVEIPDIHVRVRNDLNVLDTTAFQSSVTRVESHWNRKSGLKAVIKVAGTPRYEASQDGTFIFVDVIP